MKTKCSIVPGVVFTITKIVIICYCDFLKLDFSSFIMSYRVIAYFQTNPKQCLLTDLIFSCVITPIFAPAFPR